MDFKFDTTVYIPVTVHVTGYHPAIYDQEFPYGELEPAEWDSIELSITVKDRNGRYTKILLPDETIKIIQEDIENEVKEHGGITETAESNRECLEETFLGMYP